MKKLIHLLLIFTTACTPFVVPEPFRTEVTVVYPNEFFNGGPMKNVTVTLINLQTGREYSALTGENGIAPFMVRGGNYKAVVSVSEEHEMIIDGYPAKKTILFNGSVEGRIITEDYQNMVIRTGYSVMNEGFVIKELYTSGSRTPEGESYGADKFVEIYNNSDSVLYSDGLCFGVVHSTTTYQPTPWVDEEGNLLDRIPLWSFVSIIPGSGKDYPIPPGESIVIALSGINHRDDPNGNPNSIDLSMANWEFYVEDGKYVDAPGVPNILMQRITQGTAMIFDVRGQVCILFRLPSGNLQEVFTDPDNYMIQPGGTYKCFMVPYSWVVDGVENSRLDDRGVFKRLPNSIDVGFIQHRGSAEKVSIRRKVNAVKNGRVVYKDTNNSSEDFLTNMDPAPGINTPN